MKSRGYTLAKGDRRGFVALDERCEVFAVSKWSGLKTKDVRSKLGKPENLPSVAEAKMQIAQNMMQRLGDFRKSQNDKINARLAWIKKQQADLTAQHKQARKALEQKQHARNIQEIKERQSRFRKGFSGIWDRLNGTHSLIKKQNAFETYQALQRDRREKDALIFNQLDQRQALQNRVHRLEKAKDERAKTLSHDIQQYQDIKAQKRDAFEVINARERDGPKLER